MHLSLYLIVFGAAVIWDGTSFFILPTYPMHFAQLAADYISHWLGCILANVMLRYGFPKEREWRDIIKGLHTWWYHFRHLVAVSPLQDCIDPIIWCTFIKYGNSPLQVVLAKYTIQLPSKEVSSNIIMFHASVHQKCNVMLSHDYFIWRLMIVCSALAFLACFFACFVDLLSYNSKEWWGCCFS